MNVKPLADRLLVKPLKANEQTKSGIIIPDTVEKERPERGEVIAAGPGKFDDKGSRLPMDVKVGDVVMFKKYSPDEIKVDGEDLLILDASDVLAVIVG
jgi:chaperonin GroES